LWLLRETDSNPRKTGGSLRLARTLQKMKRKVELLWHSDILQSIQSGAQASRFATWTSICDTGGGFHATI